MTARRTITSASHDDEDPVEVERLADSGVDITEYPITLGTTERATEVGMTTAMGAPNLVRGESQRGNLSAALRTCGRHIFGRWG